MFVVLHIINSTAKHTHKLCSLPPSYKLVQACMHEHKHACTCAPSYNFMSIIHVLVQDHYYSQENGDCMAIKESSKEEDIYWEPAKSVNELYKQLCSNKYREIAREEVE